MSDLLNKASLVMVPSGYKEDTVYSVVPSDGSGDLSFTRASNGTRINSAGLVEVTPWNLIDNSNSFTAGAWVLQEVTTTSGQSDPLGGSFGWRFNETTATNQHRFYYSFIAFNTGVITQSIYVKSLGRDQIWIGANSNAENLIFTFSTETISSVTGFTSTSATSVGGGWYRITATFFGFSPINCLFVQGYNGGLSYAGDTSKGFYAFGGQLNIGSTAKPYFPTTDRLNVPRLTYQNGGGGCPSLLLEKQSTNVLLYSNTGDWGSSGTITKTYNTTDLVSPDGTNNATKVVSSAGTGDTSVGFSVPDGAVTVSFWGKVASGTKTLVLDVRNNSSAVVSSSPVLTTEWQRFTLTNTVGGTGSSGAVWIYPNGAGTFYIYGAQAESSSYATSLILTNGATATRVADACFKTGISSLIGQTEGVVFIDCNIFGIGQGQGVYTLYGTVGADVMIIYKQNDNILKLFILNGGALQVNFGNAVYTGRTKIAFAYKANDFVMYVNGSQIGASSSGSVPTCSSVNIAADDSGTQNGSLEILESVLFKTRLTNAELASLTTL